MKTRSATAAASPQPVSASQPLPTLPTRSSARKRRHSDGSSASDVSSLPTNTPVKRGRPRKGKAKVEVVIEEEDAEVMVGDENATPACDAMANSQREDFDDYDTIHVSQPSTNLKKVRFGTNAEEDEDAQAEAEAEIDRYPTTTNITPHLRKMSIKRRRSDSPSLRASVKRIKSSRTSLPPALSLDEPTQTIQEHSFAPLRAVLDERIRRLTGLHNDFTNRTIHAQLDGTTDTADDDMLVLDAQDEISISQLPAAPQTPTHHEAASSRSKELSKAPLTPGAHDRSRWAAERKQFHDAIEALEREANEATSQLRILGIELESLDFAVEGAPSLDVLHCIRESFGQAREFLETELPGSLSAEASNKDLVEILLANLQEFADRLRTADQELNDKDKLVHDLSGQIRGLLDRLAKKEIAETDGQKESLKLSESVATKLNEIAKLQHDLSIAREDINDIEEQRQNQTARADGLEAEKSELEANIERLSTSLQEYHNEETRLTEKINKMEEEHRTTVAAMNREREETVRSLEGHLDAQIKDHANAQTSLEERQTTIQELETKINALETERNQAQETLATIRDERDSEREKRETAEKDLEEKDDEIEDLAFRVRRLEEELDGYEEEVEELRELRENERVQREAAEETLDETNAKIEELNNKLRDQGKQANELRQKLFEVQKDHERMVEDSQNAAAERDLQFQNDMAVEVSRFEDAETLAQERLRRVEELEQQLDKVENEMRDTLAEREAELERLREAISQKDEEIHGLREDLQQADQQNEAQDRDNQAKIHGLKREITVLGQIADGDEATIASLEQEAIDAAQNHTAQILVRDEKIAALENEITSIQTQINNLNKDKFELERKVQDEAEFLLGFQNDKSAEVEELKQAIRDKQNKIQIVEDKVRETDRRWQDLLAARDEEIATLIDQTETQAVTIEDLNRKFTDYVRRSSNFVAKLQDQVDAAKGFVDEEGEGLKEDGDDLLEELQRLDVPHAAVTEKNGRGKKRRFDSGVGMVSSPVNAGVEMVMS